MENGELHFVHSKSPSDLAPTSMQDVVTGSDSQRVVGGTLGTLSMFAPYGGGRFLSLFRSKLDTLTIQYRDADGGLHGVIFTTTPVGTAEVTKDALVGMGAHTSIPTSRRSGCGSVASNHSDKKESRRERAGREAGKRSKPPRSPC